MCGRNYRWRATPAYDITFAKGMKQTREHRLTLYGKALSQIILQDITLATEFSIDLEFVNESIIKMQALRSTRLPKLMQEYKVSNQKQQQVLEAVFLRDFQGELDG